MKKSIFLSSVFLLGSALAVQAATDPTTEPLLQANNLTYLGAFKLPTTWPGSTYGMGNSTGCCGLGTYGVTFNPANNSIFIGGHPYEQRLTEIKIPASLTGTPVATVLQNLLDPLEGKIGTINPTDPNSKIIGGTLVYGGQLYIGAYSYYDGGSTQKKSWFKRPLNMSTQGQLTGPVQVGTTYPGWIDRSATLIPSEWQASLGGPVGFGGGGGAINAGQSWGPSLAIGDPTGLGTSNIPATLLLGYPYPDHELADTSVGNALWSQADTVAGAAAVAGTRSLIFVGYHGMGAYCYGIGTSNQSQAGKKDAATGETLCYDPDNGSKGTHAYPYRSQVWAYDMNDLVAVKKGQKNNYDVIPYATWDLDSSYKNIQGVAYDSATQRLYISQVAGDSANAGQPLIRVYQINNVGGVTPPPPTSSACDLNGDSSTNVTDVQLMVNQAIGVSACSGDVNHDGLCNVVDVQRVVNAALGGQCVTQ